MLAWTRLVLGMSTPEKITLSSLPRDKLEALAERLLADNAALSRRWRSCGRRSRRSRA